MPAQRQRSRAERNIAWIERFCVVPKGPSKGKPYSLCRIRRT